MLIQQLTKTFEDEAALSLDRQDAIEPDVIEKINRKVIIPEKFKADVDAIEKYADCSLTSGLCIELSLAELLTICPRERKRTDAYAQFKKFCLKRWG